jgi:hypothetical protein
VAGGTSGTRQEHAQIEKFVERLCRTWHGHVLRLPLDQSNNLPRSRNPHAIRNHLLAPQVEALSADRNDFKRVWVDFLKDLFRRDWPQVDIGFCFDTEYFPHYESCLEDAGVREALKNTCMVPPKFHFRKYVAETVLSCRFNLLEFFCPLLRDVLRTSVENWKGVSLEAGAELGGERTMGRRQRAFEISSRPLAATTTTPAAPRRPAPGKGC